MFRTSLFAMLLVASGASAQPSFPEPKTYPPDEATRTVILAKTAELKTAVAALEKPNPDVEIYLKAAEWIVRHEEWYTANSGKQTISVLEAGLTRAKAAKDGKTPWLDATGKPIARGDWSIVDGSTQPYSLAYPVGYDPKKNYWMEVVLHGRDSTLTEVKFLAGKDAAKADPKLDHFIVEVYGRGNNAYRWAGEADLRDIIAILRERLPVDRVVLRGFSMGGAGTWHYGLHHPDDFAAIGPGAGFTTTRGYIKTLPEKLPDYIEKCLHIYDAVDYAENVLLVPVIAYSGEKDAQKAAADNIARALKGLKEPFAFKHLVAPGLEHQQPAEWLAKCDAEYRGILKAEKKAPTDRVRFVTYTTRYNEPCDWLLIKALDEHYRKSVIDAQRIKGKATIATENIRKLSIRLATPSLGADDPIRNVAIDGQQLVLDGDLSRSILLVKSNGKWSRLLAPAGPPKPEKNWMIRGPIDDAFLDSFQVTGASAKPWHEEINRHVGVVEKQFSDLWDKHMRAKMPPLEKHVIKHEIFFGDPGSNPAIAKILPDLPITWTKDSLVVNGVKYDPKTHYPALIYPQKHQLAKDVIIYRYVVLNSGHTFKDADFRGTNALLYPRLGDWAVLKPKPTKEDPGAVEVVAAGIFDEFWQFKKEKK